MPLTLLREFTNQMPTFKPFIRRVFPAEDGRIWMWLDDASGTVTYVFDGNSEPVARYYLDKHFTVGTGTMRVVRGNIMWVEGMNEKGIPVVFRFGAQKPGVMRKMLCIEILPRRPRLSIMQVRGHV